jgi:hypothetical protein
MSMCRLGASADLSVLVEAPPPTSPKAALAVNHKPRFKQDLAMTAGIPAKGPFYNATNKGVIKLLP